jgi:hypothetical protein
MVGDLTYEVELLEAGGIPGVGDPAGLRKASAMVREMEKRTPVWPSCPRMTQAPPSGCVWLT